jgi:hypothetical protein
MAVGRPMLRRTLVRAFGRAPALFDRFLGLVA